MREECSGLISGGNGKVYRSGGKVYRLGQGTRRRPRQAVWALPLVPVKTSRIFPQRPGSARHRPPEDSTRLATKKRIAVHLELTGLLFTAGTSKRVTGRPNLDVDKSGLLEHSLPARARQAAGNSSRPQVNVADRRLRYGFPVCDISELQPSARAQHTEDLRKDPTLVGAQIDNSVADDHVGPRVLDR